MADFALDTSVSELDSSMVVYDVETYWCPYVNVGTARQSFLNAPTQSSIDAEAASLPKFSSSTINSNMSSIVMVRALP